MDEPLPPEPAPAPTSDPANPQYWTPERREEHKKRGEADRLCREGLFREAETYCIQHALSWPPFPKTPLRPPEPAPDPDRFWQLPPKKKRGGWKNPKAAEIGKLGGCPPGTEQKSKTTLKEPEQREELVEILTHNIMTGQSPIKPLRLLPMTINDAHAVYRATGMTVDQLNARLVDKLGRIIDLAADRIIEKLENDQFKPGELTFPMAIAVDKRNLLDGRSQLQGANVAIQVNHYGGTKSREELMRSLSGDIDVTPKASPAQPEPK